jgi:hypothetical protein
VKTIYAPKSVDLKQFTYEEIRQLSILPPKAKTINEYRNPQNWMPPASAIENLGKNVQCLVDYYHTAGHDEAPLPKFLEKGCMKKLIDGTIEYDFGADSYMKDVQEAIVIDQAEMLIKCQCHSKKRKQDDTPQKGARRKFKPNATSTPK